MDLLEIILSLLSYIYRKIKPLKEVSFEEATINRVGGLLYKLFFRNYTEKIWGLSCNHLSSDFVDTRLQNISLLRVIKYALIKDNLTKSFQDKFLYTKNGIGVLSNNLARDLDVRLTEAVTGLVCSKNRIEKVIVNNSKEYACRNLISTMPLPQLLEFLPVAEDVKEIANQLQYRSLICIFLILKREKFSENHWIYFPEKQIFGRMHEPKNWSIAMVPDKNKTGICLEIFCNKDSRVWQMPDSELAKRTIQDLSVLLRVDEIEDYAVVRLEHAYPIYQIGYTQELSKVKNAISIYENLFLLGRTGAFRYINMDTCLDEGMKLGRNIIHNAG